MRVPVKIHATILDSCATRDLCAMRYHLHPFKYSARERERVRERERKRERDLSLREREREGAIFTRG